MKTVLQCAILSYKSYWQPEYFDKTIQVDRVVAYIKYFPDETIIVFPGSRTETDWIRDAASIIQLNHPILGLIGFGFSIGIDDLLKIILPFLSKDIPIKIVGHSLGGPRAYYLAGLLLHNGIRNILISVIVFEPPNAGSQRLRDILAPVSIMAYQNGADDVTKIPENAIQPRDLIKISSEPPFDLLPDKWHHIQGVILSLLLKEPL